MGSGTAHCVTDCAFRQSALSSDGFDTSFLGAALLVSREGCSRKGPIAAGVLCEIILPSLVGFVAVVISDDFARGARHHAARVTEE